MKTKAQQVVGYFRYHCRLPDLGMKRMIEGIDAAWTADNKPVVHVDNRG